MDVIVGNDECKYISEDAEKMTSTTNDLSFTLQEKELCFSTLEK
jgi:hypothetical protein